MFRLKITVMAILTKICSFRLNTGQDTKVVRDTKCCKRWSFIQSFWGTDWFYNQNMGFLDLVSRLIRKINASKNVVWDISTPPSPHSIEISWVGNLIMVK